ncbi:MAG: hypothetical protein AAGA67_07690 [Cyanobacteria bacterium P01_F01_bin.153]
MEAHGRAVANGKILDHTGAIDHAKTTDREQVAIGIDGEGISTSIEDNVANHRV